MKEMEPVMKTEKLSEKTVLLRMVSTVACVVVCLIAMAFSAYAHFSSNVMSGLSTIRSASFQPQISVKLGNVNGASVSVTKVDQQTQTVRLTGNQPYCIILRHDTASTAKTGFVIVEDENGQRYHTQQLGRDGEGKTETVTFLITPTADTTIILRSHWGTSSYYSEYQNLGDQQSLYITEGEEIRLTVTSQSETQETETASSSDSASEEQKTESDSTSDSASEEQKSETESTSDSEEQKSETESTSDSEEQKTETTAQSETDGQENVGGDGDIA